MNRVNVISCLKYVFELGSVVTEPERIYLSGNVILSLLDGGIKNNSAGDFTSERSEQGWFHG